MRYSAGLIDLGVGVVQAVWIIGAIFATGARVWSEKGVKGGCFLSLFLTFFRKSSKIFRNVQKYSFFFTLPAVLIENSSHNLAVDLPKCGARKICDFFIFSNF